MSGPNPYEQFGPALVAQKQSPEADSNPYAQFGPPIEAAPASAPDPKDFAAFAQEQFDKGATREQMDKLAVDHGLQPFGKDLDFALQARAKGATVRIDPPADKPYSAIQSMSDGALKVLNNVGRAIEQIPGVPALEQFGHDAFGMAPSIDAAEQAQNSARDASGYRSGEAGKFAGEMIATAPTMLAGSPLVAGALSGAAVTDKRTLAGVAQDAALGGVSGGVGDLATRAVGRIVAPVVNPMVQRLLDAGIPLTPGQIVGQGGFVGRSVKRIEDSISNLPLVGTAIRGTRARGQDALNRAAVNRALAPIGEALPGNIELGHAAVAHAGDRLSAAYNDVLPRLSGTVDQAFANRIAAIQARAGLPPEYAPQVNQIMTELGRAFTQNPGANGQFTGRTLRDASDRLDKLATVWRTNGQDPYLRQVGDVAQQVRDQLHALARRQNPADAARLRDIDRGYASLVRVEKAAANTDEGVFTAKGYKTATRSADRSARNRQSARGQALDQDLSSAAATVMPSTVGEGGSNAVNGLALMGALGVGALGGAPGAIGAIGAGTAGSLLYTRGGQRVAQYALARPTGATSRYVSDLLRQAAPAVGQAAAVNTPSMVSSAIN